MAPIAFRIKSRIHWVIIRKRLVFFCSCAGTLTMNNELCPENAIFSPYFSLHILLPPIETNFAFPLHLSQLRNSSVFLLGNFSVISLPFPKRPSYAIMQQYIHTLFKTLILRYAVCLSPHLGCEFLNRRDQSQCLCIPSAWHTAVIQYMFAEKTNDVGIYKMHI